MNLLIRADSSSQIGLGHIMRDLVLAQQYPHANIIFACQNLAGNIMDNIPYAVHVLKSNTPEELIEVIKDNNISRVIFDHYEIDHLFEKMVKESTGITIVSLDDTYQKHCCDILINPNIYADEKRYSNLIPVHCKLRCGDEFILIRDEFRKEKLLIREKIYDIFIAMGGSDPKNLTLNILQTLTNALRICVVTTTANSHLDVLKKIMKENDNVTLHINSPKIAKLLHQSRLAIITPSVIANEAYFMELPFIAIQTADNQKEMVKFLEKNSYTAIREFNSAILTKQIEEMLR